MPQRKMSVTQEGADALPTSGATPSGSIATGFYLILAGQFVSALGSQLTGFGLGVWLFQQTGSVLNFTTLALSATLPGLLLLPWSGSIADRWNRRTILVSCELVSIACVSTLTLMLHFASLNLIGIVLLQMILSASAALQGPAFYATVSALVPKDALPRASGIAQMGTAVVQLAGPMLGALALQSIGIAGITTLDALSFLATLAALLAVRFPDASTVRLGMTFKSVLSDFRWLVGFMREFPPLAILNGLGLLFTFLTDLVAVLISPLVLANHSSGVLAAVSTCAGVGVLVSGGILTVWRGANRFPPFALGLIALQGAAITVAASVNSPSILCAGALIANTCNAVFGTCISILWRRKVPSGRQGTFAAFQQAIALMLMPLSAAIGGALASYVFEPAMSSSGAWAGTIGPWFGTGPGRGMALLFASIGIALALVSLWAITLRSLRQIDTRIADAH